MKNFDRLQAQCLDGSIQLINMIAVPRSISTALGRILNESGEPSIFVNEPFNRHNRDLDVAAGHILEAAQEAKPADKSLTVITKNMATYLSDKSFHELSATSNATVWSVRDPLIQMGSLLTRMANDIAVETGADRITQDELGPHLQKVTETLKDSPISHDFSRTSWQSIGDQFRMRTGENVVVDGGQLTVSPRDVLIGACRTISLTFREQMIDGWQSDYTNVNIGSSRFGTAENAWTSHAATSRGIVAPDRQALDVQSLPSDLRDHIQNIVIPTYEMMVSS